MQQAMRLDTCRITPPKRLLGEPPSNHHQGEPPRHTAVAPRRNGVEHQREAKVRLGQHHTLHCVKNQNAQGLAAGEALPLRIFPLETWDS